MLKKILSILTRRNSFRGTAKIKVLVVEHYYDGSREWYEETFDYKKARRAVDGGFFRRHKPARYEPTSESVAGVVFTNETY